MHFLFLVKISIRMRGISIGQMNKALDIREIFAVRGQVGSLMLFMFIAIPFTFHNGEHLHRLGSPSFLFQLCDGGVDHLGRGRRVH